MKDNLKTLEITGSSNKNKMAEIKEVGPSKHEYFASLLDSETIAIKIGAKGETISVHRSLFSAADSASLRAVVSGTYAEGHGEKGLDWTAEDAETVKRMVTFLYTGDYYVSMPDVKKSDPDIPEVEPEYESKQTNDDEGMRPLTPIQFHLRKGLPTWRCNTEAGNLQFVQKPGKEFAYGPSMLDHAKLFVLADFHQLDSLMKLALQRLTQTLLYAETSSYDLLKDTIPLIVYTYHGSDLARPLDLRELVSQWVALHYHELDGEELLEILEKGGDFVRDVCPKIGRRILAQEIKAGGGRGRIAHKIYQKNKQSTTPNGASVRQFLSQ
ncbi:hypothetical protein ABW20_dc0102669 [Dactylellina cionopaga]|nr:hypothetical protein ABW20_dc0102669 [Dactylellina cionopaga]